MNRTQKKGLTFLLLIAITGSALLYVLSGNPFSQGENPPPYVPPEDQDGDGFAESFSMFQALRVVYPDGSDSWKYPNVRTDLPYSLTIIDSDTGRTASSLQAYVFFNYLSSKSVYQVIFSCDLALQIYDASTGALVKDLTGWMPLSQTLNNPQNNTDVYIISSTITASDFQALIVPSGVQLNQYYSYVISARNINAEVIYADSTFGTYSLTGIQSSQNILYWKFRLFQSGNVMQIVYEGVMWEWT